MKVLVVTPALVYPGIPHAGGLYVLKHLEQLVAAGLDVTLLCVDDKATPEVRARVPEWLHAVVVEPAAPRDGAARLRDGLRQRLRLASLAPEGVEALRAGGLVDLALEADVVEIHWPELGVLVPFLRAAGVRTPICVVEHDVGAQAAGRRVAAHGSLADRLTYRLARPLRNRVERADLDAADLLLVFKQADVDLLRALGVRTAVQVIDPYLDPPTSPAPGVREPGHVLFTGALWRPDTTLALRWFLAEVWPRVHAHEPEALLTLAGAGPSDELRAAADAAGGVVVTGEVPDLEPYYHRASSFVAPLRAGGGLKFKVPQAMLHGLPVVATTIAAEGIVDVAPPGTFWAVADEPGPMADALISLLRDPDRGIEVGEAARRWCLAHFSFERSMAAVVARYRDLAEVAG